MSGKRKADKQLTHRDLAGENEEEEEEEGGGDGNWQRASSETMKKRRVVKARRRCKGEHHEEDHPSSPAEPGVESETFPKIIDTEKKEPTTTTATTTKTPAATWSTFTGITTPPSWPSFSFGPPKTDGKGETSAASTASTTGLTPFTFGQTSGIATPPSWPSFSFGTKTDGKVETAASSSTSGSALPSFSFGTAASSSSTGSELPSFSFGTVGTTKPSDFGITFSWSSVKDGEKKEDVGTDTKWPSLIKENENKIEWPSFGSSFSTNFSFSTSANIGEKTTTSETSPLKLDASIGTLSGVGSDANKTRELTSTFPSSFGSTIWGRDIQPPKDPVTGIGSSSPESKNVKLNKLDSHTTGEEGETTEIEIRGRLYEFVKEEGKSTWKERGVGPFKINCDLSNHRYRIIMRTDNALRVVLNGLLYNEMTYEKISDRQIRFTCVSTTEGQTQKVGSYLLKLANPSDTDSLKQVFFQCQPKSKPLSLLQVTPKKGGVTVSEKVGSVTSDVTATTETEAVSTSDATESKGGATESEDASTTESTVTDTTVSELKPQLEV